MSSSEGEQQPARESRYVRYRRRKRLRRGDLLINLSPDGSENDSQDSSADSPRRHQRTERRGSGSGEGSDSDTSHMSNADEVTDRTNEEDLDAGGHHTNSGVHTEGESIDGGSDEEHGQQEGDTSDTSEGGDFDGDRDEAEDSDGSGRAAQEFEATSESDLDIEDLEAERALLGDDVPLYENATLTVRESLMSILTVASVHKLTGTCVADILQLIRIHCPPDNNCLKTFYFYQKSLAKIGNSSFECHYYCTNCVFPLASKEAECPSCQASSGHSFFLTIPIQKQLQAIMGRPGVFDSLLHRFNRTKSNENNIEDVYDGQLYQDHFKDNGFLSDPCNISFGWYTDGVSVYNSSSFQIWPIYFTINELPYIQRMQKSNTLLVGLWFGNMSPNPNVFLRPVLKDVRKFRTRGYQITLPGPNERVVTMRGMVLQGTADLPAKAKFLKMKQFNGFFGCLLCEIEGERYVINRANQTTIHVYRYSDDIVPRQNDDVLRYAQLAMNRRREGHNDCSVRGVKGLSILYHMVPNMIRCTAIDKMHGVDYGVAKLVTSLLFDSSHSEEQFSFSESVGLVNNRLSKIRPPSFVERMPRVIPNSKTRQWHSQEYKQWLAYYSIPLLLGIVSNEILGHHCLLVSAVYLLVQPSVSNDCLNEASRLLHKYVSQFQEIYGLRFMGINVHNLLHLPQVVSDLGPLWVYSCYFYEDLNGKLVSLIHGTRHAGTQVCSAASTYLNLDVMISEMRDGQPRQFCEKVNSRVKSVKIADVISPAMFAVGTYERSIHPDDDEVVQNALVASGVEHSRRLYFHRLRKKGVMYYSSSYHRETQRESSYIEFHINGTPKLGKIKNFVKVTECDCPVACLCPAQYFCFASLLERHPWFIHEDPDFQLPYLHLVTLTNNFELFPCSAILSLCFYIKVDDKEYVATPLNVLEAD